MILFLVMLFSSNLNSIARADKDDDYINTLPSEERYAFLEKVSRRIVQEARAVETPKATSFEIPDAMVAKSNEFVNKVVAEELAKIKTGRKNNKNRRPARKLTGPEDRADKYINFTFRTVFYDGMKDDIGLTAAKKGKSIDAADVKSIKGDAKVVRKREISEVPVQVVLDEPRRSKSNEKSSREHDAEDDYDRKDNKTVEEESREKYLDFDRSKDDAKTSEEASKAAIDLELNKKNVDAETLESTESKDVLDGKEPSKSAELNKNVSEGEENTDVDKLTIKSTEATPPTVKLDNIKTTEDEVVTMRTDAMTNVTQTPSTDQTTFLERLNDDTYHTTEVFLDTTKVQPLTESIVPCTTMSATQESQKPPARIPKLKTENIILSTAEEPKSTVATTTTRTLESALSNTEKLRITDTQTPETNKPTVQKPKSSVTTTEKSKRTTAYIQELESTASTVIEFKNLPMKKSLRIGDVSEELDERNVVNRGQLLRAGGKVTDAPLHFETLFDVERKPTKKVRIQEVAEERVAPSNSHQHGILYYRVYEVDPYLDPLKLRSEGNGNQDQPHYAPVYNYEPESVFLSQQNRQGPSRGAEDDDEDANLRQTSGAKVLRTNVDQEFSIPLYNYEPLNAYYNPQNRLGPNEDNAKEDLYYKQAGVKRARDGKAIGKIDKDYYYARNEAIQDSLESRKFHFRGILNAGNSGKSRSKSSLVQNKLQNPSIHSTAHTSKYQDRNQQNGDYVDYYYGRKGGLRHQDKKGQKRRHSDILSVNLNDNFGKKKKATLTRNRHSQNKPFYELISNEIANRKQKTPADGRPISIDYYFGVDGPLLYKLNHKAVSPKVSVEKSTRDGFQHRIKENNAIDLDYYFDRKDTNDDRNADEDFQDYDDRDNADADVTVSRKSHKNKGARDAEKYVLRLYTRVLKDMFEIKSDIFMKYDWLATTVNIRSALAKLFNMIDAEERGEVINAKDKEILKYLIAVHEEAANMTRAVTKSYTDCVVASAFRRVLSDALRYNSQRGRLALPKNKRRKPGDRIRNPLKLMRDAYMHLLRSCSDAKEEETARGIKEFKLFLKDLEDGLYDFHTAIKSVASVTKYDRQNWHQNIRDLYLSRTKGQSKELLEVMTHLVLAEMIERIEQSARDGMEDDAAKYREDHPDEFEETKNELRFVLRLLREINKDDK